MTSIRVDSLTIAGLALLTFMGLNLLNDLLGNNAGLVRLDNLAVKTETEPNLEGTAWASETSLAMKEEADEDAFAAPYDKYTVTQGPHGSILGHVAIDLAAGKGTPVKSPIHGVVSDLYVDQYGNPTLVIENDRYRVTLLHGEYTVNLGDEITLGQSVGFESNLGYTTDMQGRPCRNRNCGYHTHLNVFDKKKGENVNPLKLLEG